MQLPVTLLALGLSMCTFSTATPLSKRDVPGPFADCLKGATWDACRSQMIMRRGNAIPNDKGAVQEQGAPFNMATLCMPDVPSRWTINTDWKNAKDNICTAIMGDATKAGSTDLNAPAWYSWQAQAKSYVEQFMGPIAKSDISQLVRVYVHSDRLKVANPRLWLVDMCGKAMDKAVSVSGCTKAEKAWGRTEHMAFKDAWVDVTSNGDPPVYDQTSGDCTNCVLEMSLESGS